jgi:regulator of protease activity HflC (stomatin/prohibitin superfamily)
MRAWSLFVSFLVLNSSLWAVSVNFVFRFQRLHPSSTGVQQLDVRVETKTKDNVFLQTVVSVQYQVLREKVYQAFYSLTNPQQQITSHVYDVMRSQLPTLELDAVFEAKEELALAVKNALQETMSEYGYQILQALITDIDPDVRVKQAMNEINSAKRLKFAVAEQAEGKKM